MIDASIPLQARGVQVEPQTNRLARVLAIQGAMNQNRVAEMAMRDAEDEKVRRNKLREILAGGGTPEDLLRAGYTSEYTSLKKADLDNRKTTAEIDSKTFETNKKRLEAGLAAGAALLNTQEPLSRDHVVLALAPYVQSGVVDMNFATKFVNGLPQDDAGIRAALKRGMIGSMDAVKQLEALTPKVEFQDDGQQRVAYNVNANAPGGVGPMKSVAPIQKRLTPGEAASQGLARERFNFEQQQPVIVPGVGAYARTQGGFAPLNDAAGNPMRAPTAAETAAQNRSSSAERVINVLDSADTLPDGTKLTIEDLIKASTGSYAGWTRDQIMRIGGYSTDGSKAGARLKVIGPNIMLAQPRMEGPQSDRDVQLYREAAAQLGDTTVPVEDRLAAASTLRRLQAEYAPGGAKYTPPRGGVPAAPVAAPAPGGRLGGGPVKRPGQPAPAAPGGIRVIGVTFEGR